jgi:hypothetical protein
MQRLIGCSISREPRDWWATWNSSGKFYTRQDNMQGKRPVDPVLISPRKSFIGEGFLVRAFWWACLNTHVRAEQDVPCVES